MERLNDHKTGSQFNVHARVVVYMYLIFVMTGQNISNDGNKGVQFCISPAFIELGIKVWHVSMLNAR